MPGYPELDQEGYVLCVGLLKDWMDECPSIAVDREHEPIFMSEMLWYHTSAYALSSCIVKSSAGVAAANFAAAESFPTLPQS